MDTETCKLYEIAGLRETCPRDGCAFWENGGCVVDQLGSPVEGRPDIAAWLLDVRRALEANAPAADLSAFHRSLAKGKE
jgi:hypothetical protein